LLFAAQSRGTARVAAFFGPITAIWFVAIAIPGIVAIAGDPWILLAINPFYGLKFLVSHGVIGLVTLGAVFLAVTGAEALYADLGHFGRRPIQTAWLAFVFPSLALNYLGQGALLLADPSAIENPFFLLYPNWAQLPMVLLATAATVIASQAVITGAYSLTHQAISSGCCRALRFATRRKRVRARSICPASIRCCFSACCFWSRRSVRQARLRPPTGSR
jgi:K+ transporter